MKVTLIRTIVIGATSPAVEIDRMFCARQVFRCFKYVEKLGERLVGAVGPYFVATALSMISVGVVCFCTSCSPPTSARKMFELLAMCTSRSYMANVILPLDCNANMPADRFQPIRTLLLCLHGSTWFCRRSATRNWYRVFLVRATAGVQTGRSSAGFRSQVVREAEYHPRFSYQVQKVWAEATRGVPLACLINKPDTDSFFSREVSSL